MVIPAGDLAGPFHWGATDVSVFGFFFSLGLIRFLREDFLVSYLNIYHLAASQSERVGRSQ